MTGKKYIYLVVEIIILVLVLYGFELLYAKYHSNQSAPMTTYATLMQQNADFAQGEQLLFTDNNPKAAIAAYTTALSSATTPADQSQIIYKIAYANDLEGNVQAAIPLFKQIVANTAYPPDIRAYAGSYLAMEYTKGNAAVRSEIMSGEPYASMVVKGNDVLTLRHLNEYVVSIYPLAIPELNIAEWYTNDILSLDSTTTTQAKADWQQVQQGLSSADLNITQIQNDLSLKLTITEALQTKAIILGQLSSVGLVPTSDADTAFQQAFTVFKQYGVNDGALRYCYAVYLLNFGNARVSDIQTTLAPFSANASAYNVTSGVGILFNTLSEKNVAGQQINIRKLVAIDPGFGTYLMSVGWTASELGSTSPQ